MYVSFMSRSCLCEALTVTVTPSSITTPAPMLPVVAKVCPFTRLKYPDICPGQNAVTDAGVMAVNSSCEEVGLRCFKELRSSDGI